MKAYELTSNEEISRGVHIISFKRDFEFTPGQVVEISLSPDQVPRIYSICSGHKEDEIRILFNVKEGGELTPQLGSLIPGEVIFVSEPYGKFADTKAPACWIATGTGIAPFYSMFQSGLAENKTLIHGVRQLTQFYFEDEWEQALGENYVRCCSGESSCDTFPGRVTDYLRQLNQLPDINFFICGKALMVVEVRDLLIEKGVPFNKIFAEIYF